MSDVTRQEKDDSDDILKGSPQRRAVAFIATLLDHYGDIPMSLFSSTQEWGEPQAFQRMRRNINEIWEKMTGRVLFYEVNARGQRATRGPNRRIRLNQVTNIAAAVDTAAYVAASSSLIRSLIEGTMLAKYSDNFQKNFRSSLKTQERLRFDNIQKKFCLYFRAAARIDRNKEILDTIIKCVIQQCAVTIVRHNDQTPQLMKPLSIVFEDENFYLVCCPWNDTDISGLVGIPIVQMKDVLPHPGMTFTYPKGYSPRTSTKKAFGSVASTSATIDRVHLRVHTQSGAYDYLSTRRLSPVDQWIKTPDGNWDFYFDAYQGDDVKRLILSLGSQVEVLAPRDLRNAMAREAMDLSRTYDAAKSPVLEIA